MDFLKTILFSASIVVAGSTDAKNVRIYNPAPFDRKQVIAEIPGEKVLSASESEFVVYDSRGEVVPHQLTYNGQILIQTDIKAGGTVNFKIGEGKCIPTDTVCVGQIRHDMQDDFAWENDRAGYRLYGPSYRNGGGNVTGYDIWTKSVGFPVLAQRYADNCRHGISYHKDHGNGMDCYTVGRTLGAGMNALAPGGDIHYPCAYEKCEILDNGPFRTTARLTCYPENVGNYTDVVEERVISLDKGSWLNKTQVRYDGLGESCPMVTGIVIHKQNTGGYALDPEKRYMAYADLTDNPDNGNGVIYIGIVNEKTPDTIIRQDMEPAAGDAVGQLLNMTEIAPGETYTYYWGSGWSKGGVGGFEEWLGILDHFHESLRYPLEITVE